MRSTLLTYGVHRSTYTSANNLYPSLHHRFKSVCLACFRFFGHISSASAEQTHSGNECFLFTVGSQLRYVTHARARDVLLPSPGRVGGAKPKIVSDVLLVFHTNSLKHAGSAYGGHEVPEQRRAHIKRPAVGSKPPPATLSNFIT